VATAPSSMSSRPIAQVVADDLRDDTDRRR
jgi:hypothetical protein